MLFTHNKKTNQLYGNVASFLICQEDMSARRLQCYSDIGQSVIVTNDSQGLALNTITVPFTASSSGFEFVML